MGRKRVPLGNYVTEYSVRNKGDEDIPVYSVTNSQGFCTDYFDKEVASKDKKTYKIVPKGYFAYNPSRINVGSVDWQKYEERVIVSPLYNVFSVSENLEQQYLFYFLRSDVGKQMIKSKVSGSVRDNLKIDMLKEMTIPEMSIEEQKKCVHILDTLKIIISLRKKELDKLDNLIKARFVEMFGDPVRNSKNWNTEKLCSIAPINKYNGDIDKFNGKVWLLNLDMIESRTGNIVDFLYEFENRITSSTIKFDENCVLYSKLRPYLNKVVIPGRKGYATSELVSMSTEKINKYFLANLLRQDSFVNFSNATAYGAKMPRASMDLIKNFDVINPPTELQNQFGKLVIEVEKSKLITYYHHKSIYTKPQLCCKMVIVNDFLNIKMF